MNRYLDGRSPGGRRRATTLSNGSGSPLASPSTSRRSSNLELLQEGYFSASESSEASRHDDVDSLRAKLCEARRKLREAEARAQRDAATIEQLRERCGRLEAEPAEARHQADAAAAWNFELLAAEIDTLRAENAALRAAHAPID